MEYDFSSYTDIAELNSFIDDIITKFLIERNNIYDAHLNTNLVHRVFTNDLHTNLENLNRKYRGIFNNLTTGLIDTKLLNKYNFSPYIGIRRATFQAYIVPAMFIDLLADETNVLLLDTKNIVTMGALRKYNLDLNNRIAILQYTGTLLK